MPKVYWEKDAVGRERIPGISKLLFVGRKVPRVGLK